VLSFSNEPLDTRPLGLESLLKKKKGKQNNADLTPEILKWFASQEAIINQAQETLFTPLRNLRNLVLLEPRPAYPGESALSRNVQCVSLRPLKVIKRRVLCRSLSSPNNEDVKMHAFPGDETKDPGAWASKTHNEIPRPSQKNPTQIQSIARRRRIDTATPHSFVPSQVPK